LESLARPSEVGLHRAERSADDRRDLPPRHLLPVTELEQDLVIERDPPQGLEQEPLLLLPADDGARRGRELLRADTRELEPRAVPVDAPIVLAEDVARDAEQVRAERGGVRDSRQPLEAAEERPLDQVVGGLGQLAAEETRETIVVALEELRARLALS